jgi:hypothetical protein
MTVGARSWIADYEITNMCLICLRRHPNRLPFHFVDDLEH